MRQWQLQTVGKCWRFFTSSHDSPLSYALALLVPLPLPIFLTACCPPPLRAAMSRAVFLFIRRFCVLLALFSTWPRTFHNTPKPAPAPRTTLLSSDYLGTTFRDPFYFVCPFWTLASSTRVHFQLSVLPVAFPCCCCYSCCYFCCCCC